MLALLVGPALLAGQGALAQDAPPVVYAPDIVGIGRIFMVVRSPRPGDRDHLLEQVELFDRTPAHHRHPAPLLLPRWRRGD